MATPSREISLILQKYDKEERLLDELLQERIKQEHELDSPKWNKVTATITREDAIKRNNNLLKDLEAVKARLRSKAIFTTTEMQWESICRKYQEHPSLMPTKWRCRQQSPVFV